MRWCDMTPLVIIASCITNNTRKTKLRCCEGYDANQSSHFAGTLPTFSLISKQRSVPLCSA